MSFARENKNLSSFKSIKMSAAGASRNKLAPNWSDYRVGKGLMVYAQEAQARFARAHLCLPYNEGRKETLRPK
jgi:hypothetical protein